MSGTSRRGADRASRLARAAALGGTSGKVCPADRATRLLEAIIEPGDRVTIEGDNQKQADFLAAALANVDPARVHDLHMVQSVLALPDHLAVFERGIANRLDFSYAGPQSRKLAELVAANAVRIGAIHTYLELYARMLVDLTPQVALVVADKADRDGNLYTGPNTEDTPTIIEAAAFRGGIVVAQVNEIVDHLPRVDVPGDWIDFVIPSPKSYLIDPLFTRDPAKIRNENVLMAMMAVAAVYEPYQVRRLNHGIGYATAAIELILPTFAARRGLKGKVAGHFVLNPHPTLIPAIEAGWLCRQRLLLRLRAGHGTLCLEPRRYIPGWRRRPSAVQPRARTGRGTICLRPLHRRHVADRRAGQQLDGHQGPHHRLRGRA
jgi:malonate decarboxylase alpha subunit